jgi:pimeloyl-ACP methyl ester carboxylesterase
VLVHGTWSRRRGKWWTPDGAFNDFLRSKRIFPRLYCGDEPFQWSGYYSWRMRMPRMKVDWNRDQASGSLAWWTHCELSDPPNLIGHSYGASICMRMTNLKKRAHALVLLSPAVHESCLPAESNYAGALVVRMEHDLVLLADGSRPELLWRLPRVKEWIVPGSHFTRHGATHEASTWQSNGLDTYVRDRWLPSL